MSPGVTSAISLASLAFGSVAKGEAAVGSLAACSAMAFTTRSSAWPRLLKANCAVKSRYCLPEVS